jgi:hypothetical protein
MAGFENLDFLLDGGNGYEAGDGVNSTNGVIFNDVWTNLFTAISQFFGFGYYLGSNCDDKASGAASCEIFLMLGGSGTTTQRKRGATAGQYARVHYYSGGEWYVWQVAVQEDGSGYPYIQFDSADCDSHSAADATAAVPDYANATFIDNLRIFVADVFPKVYSSDIITNYEASEALLATGIATDNTASDAIGTEYGTTKTDVELAITTGTGKIKADQVDADSIDKAAAMSDDNPINLLKDGTTRNFLEGQDIAYGLEKYGLATSWAEETTIIPYPGKSTQEIVAGGSDVGVAGVLAHDVYAAELAGEYVTVVATGYTSVANNIKIGIWDDVTGLVTDTPTLGASAWKEASDGLYATVQVTAGATEVKAVILTAGAGTIYVTDIAMYRGDSVFKHHPSPEAVVIHHTLDNQVYNDFPFGDCAREYATNAFPGHAWLNGVSTYPFPWDGTTFGGTYAQETTEYHSANASISATIAATEGLTHLVGLGSTNTSIMQKYKGKACTFSCFLLKNGANTDYIDLQIVTDGTGGTTTTKRFYVNDYDTWGQIAVTLNEVPSDAGYIIVRIRNNGTADVTCYLDSFSVTQSAHPVAFSTLTCWQYLEYHFTYAGSQPLTATRMYAQNLQQISVPIGINLFAFGATVYQDVSAIGDDLYYCIEERPNGAGGWNLTNNAGAWTVTVGNGEDFASAADTDGLCPDISAGTRLGMYVDGDDKNPGQDAYAILHCLTYGI